MGFDQFPQDDNRDELLDREREEALAEQEAALQLFDERSSAEAFHRDAAQARIEAHRVFDAIWKSGAMKRAQAYQWMQSALGLQPGQAHIARFSPEQCERLIRLVKARGA